MTTVLLTLAALGSAFEIAPIGTPTLEEMRRRFTIPLEEGELDE